MFLMRQGGVFRFLCYSSGKIHCCELGKTDSESVKAKMLSPGLGAGDEQEDTSDRSPASQVMKL